MKDSIFNGIWLFGETGFTGSSLIPDYLITESKTWFQIPEWFPFWKYRTYGLQHHSKKTDKYNLDTVKKVMKYFDIVVGEFTDQGEVKNKMTLDKCLINLVNEQQHHVMVYHNDEYVGDLRWAYDLIKRGIYDPKPLGKGGTCCYGKSDLDGKWYGWSHRAMYGFTVGSTVKKGDCAYFPKNEDDYMESMKLFWSSEDHLDIKVYKEEVEGKSGCRVEWTYSDKILNKDLRNQINSVFNEFPSEYGKGEWFAQTENDAMQMARDFARGVS